MVQNNNPAIIAAIVLVSIGVAVIYGALKLLGWMFGSKPKANRMLSIGEMQVYVVNNIKQLHNQLEELKLHCREYNVLGFDCEWESRPRYGRRRIAMLQLCTYRGFCVLIRLSKFGYIPPELAKILADINITKVGNTPDNDAIYLRDDYGVHVASTLDLRFMARKARCNPGKLATMSRDYLGLELDKSYAITEWEADCLSEEEIDYAAKDAFAGMELFKYFDERIALAPEGTVKFYCWEYLNRKYK